VSKNTKLLIGRIAQEDISAFEPACFFGGLGEGGMPAALS